MNLKLIVFCLTLFFIVPANAEQTYVLARAPQLSSTITSKLWGPFVKKLSADTNSKIILKIYPSREDFEEELRKGDVDFYFGNPGYGVVGHLRHGYIPLIRSNKKMLEGIIVVKKDSGINSITQLNNKTISFPDRTAFAASLYLRSDINENIDIKYTPSFSGAHDNTYRAVLIGKADAGGGVVRTLQQENDQFRQQLKIIYKTPGIQPHPLMAHPRVPKELRKKIQQAILDLNKTESGKELLKTIKLQKPVISNYENDYKKIEIAISKMYRHLLD